MGKTIKSIGNKAHVRKKYLEFYNLKSDDFWELKNRADIYQISREIYGNHNYTAFVDYSSIAKYLNGYARQLRYEVYTKDQHLVFDPRIKSSSERM